MTPEQIEKKNADGRTYSEANREKLRVNARARYQVNKDKYKAYREVNKERLNALARERYEANKEKLRAYNRARYARKKVEANA